jgi:hypothetical protein
MQINFSRGSQATQFKLRDFAANPSRSAGPALAGQIGSTVQIQSKFGSWPKAAIVGSWVGTGVVRGVNEAQLRVTLRVTRNPTDEKRSIHAPCRLPFK